MTINFFLFFPLFPFFVFSFLLSSYPPCYLLFILILRFCSSVFILFCLSCVCYLSFIDYPLLLHPICSFSFFILFVHFPSSSHLFIFLLHLICSFSCFISFLDFPSSSYLSFFTDYGRENPLRHTKLYRDGCRL